MPVFREVMAHAAVQPHRVAVRCGEAVRTYAQLARDAERARPDVKPGALVPLTDGDPVTLLTGLLAADGAGAVPLVCDPSWLPAHRRALLAGLPTTVSAGDDAHDLAWAGFTSGSTGRPRVVVRSRSSWVASYPAVTRLTGITADDTVLVPGPLASSLTAFAALHALATGATVVLTATWSAPVVRAAVADADVVHLVPPALATVVDARPPRLRTAVVGGAALGAGWRERAAVAGIGIVAYYGAAELSFVAVDADGSGLRPFPEVEIELRGREVWVRSPWLAHGYLGDGDGPLRRDETGWATVGDLADADADAGPTAPLRLRGRADGAVLTGGATVVPEDVEAVLATVPRVDGVVVVGLPHADLGEIVVAVVQGDGVSRAALVAAARDRLAPAQRPRRWLTIDELPRTSTGKPARRLIHDGVGSGALPTWPLT